MRIPDPRDIIIKPVISEKSYGLLGDHDLVDQRDVDLLREDLVRELDASLRRALAVLDLDGRHGLLAPLHGGADENQATVGTGNRTLDQKAALLGVN